MADRQAGTEIDPQETKNMLLLVNRSPLKSCDFIFQEKTRLSSCQGVSGKWTPQNRQHGNRTLRPGKWNGSYRLFPPLPVLSSSPFSFFPVTSGNDPHSTCPTIGRLRSLEVQSSARVCPWKSVVILRQSHPLDDMDGRNPALGNHGKP